jgi:hypothetical protein
VALIIRSKLGVLNVRFGAHLRMAAPKNLPAIHKPPADYPIFGLPAQPVDATLALNLSAGLPPKADVAQRCRQIH